MSHWRRFTRGLRSLVRQDLADREVDAEVAHYFDEATAELIASGMSPADARRAARLQLGDVTAVREHVRASGWEAGLGTLIADLRYGARRLRRNPGFTAASIVTLALGIGASTAIFSAVNPILFESLPYPGAERIVTVWDFGAGGSRLEVTFGSYRELVERSRDFDAAAVIKPWQPTITGPSEPERLEGDRVSASYFRVLGVPPALGRDFDAADDRPNAPRSAIISDALWRRRFNRDRAIIGRQMTLDDESYTVVGVMPRTFENVLNPASELWTLLLYDMSQGRAWGHHLRMVARLKTGVDASRADQQLDAIAGTVLPEFPRPSWADLSTGLMVTPLQQDITAGVRPALLAVLGAVMLVLAIACVNVTNLLLARGAQRRAEFALRAALGASRARLTRQLITESLLLAMFGGLLGMFVAELGVRTLVALSPPGLPRVDAIRVDGVVFLFGFGISTLIGLLVGLVPAMDAFRTSLHGNAQQVSHRASRRHQRTRRVLVVAEVALALVLLVGAGLLVRSLQRLFAISPGFDASHVLTMQVQTSGRRFDKPTTDRFFAQVLDAVRRVPGVAAAEFTNQLPLSGQHDEYGVAFEADLGRGANSGYPAFRYAVSPGYLRAMGIPILRGRSLDAHDASKTPRAVLISESFAKQFQGVDVIGQRVHVGPSDQPWYTIVGVAGNVRQVSLALESADAVYLPSEQWAFADSAMWLVVRGHGDVAALAPAVRAAVWSVDKDQPIVRVATMQDLVTVSAAQRRFALILFEAFALASLVLAAIGLYGVLSGSVTERTREIGVRAALGASRGDILSLIVRQGMTLTLLGAAIGLVGAAAASGALVTLLFETSTLDPVTYVGMIALLLAVSAVACWIPALRAARVDPSITLRAE
jgi:putative ABC transport system permease protein